jgi:hypothetical protein
MGYVLGSGEALHNQYLLYRLPSLMLKQPKERFLSSLSAGTGPVQGIFDWRHQVLSHVNSSCDMGNMCRRRSCWFHQVHERRGLYLLDHLLLMEFLAGEREKVGVRVWGPFGDWDTIMMFLDGDRINPKADANLVVASEACWVVEPAPVANEWQPDVDNLLGVFFLLAFDA